MISHPKNVSAAIAEQLLGDRRKLFEFYQPEDLNFDVFDFNEQFKNSLMESPTPFSSENISFLCEYFSSLVVHGFQPNYLNPPNFLNFIAKLPRTFSENDDWVGIFQLLTLFCKYPNYSIFLFLTHYLDSVNYMDFYNAKELAEGRRAICKVFKYIHTAINDELYNFTSNDQSFLIFDGVMQETPTIDAYYSCYFPVIFPPLYKYLKDSNNCFVDNILLKQQLILLTIFLPVIEDIEVIQRCSDIFFLYIEHTNTKVIQTTLQPLSFFLAHYPQTIIDKLLIDSVVHRLVFLGRIIKEERLNTAAFNVLTWLVQLGYTDYLMTSIYDMLAVDFQNVQCNSNDTQEIAYLVGHVIQRPLFTDAPRKIALLNRTMFLMAQLYPAMKTNGKFEAQNTLALYILSLPWDETMQLFQAPEIRLMLDESVTVPIELFSNVLHAYLVMNLHDNQIWEKLGLKEKLIENIDIWLESVGEIEDLEMAQGVESFLQTLLRKLFGECS